jgi:MFS family permease
MTQEFAEPSYRTLLGNRRILAVLAAVNIGRLASGMVPFGMIATFTSEHQLGWAGAAFAAFLVGAAVFGPHKGALVDRVGTSRLLVPMAVLFASVVTVAALLEQGADTALYPVALVLTVAAAGLAPPNSAVLRSVWTEIARNDAENKRMHSLDSVLEETTFVVTPLLTSGIWAVFGAHWAIIVGAFCALAGTLWFSRIIAGVGAEHVVRGSQAGSTPGSATSEGRQARGIRTVLLSRNGIAILCPMLALGVVMGALSVGYPAWTLRHSHVQLAGILMSLDSMGGIVAGILYGRLPEHRIRPWRRYFTCILILVLGTLLVAASTSLPVVMLGSLVVGASLTPMYVIAFVLVGPVFPKERHTLVNASIGSAYNLGSGCAALAVGAALGRWQLSTTLICVALVALVLGAGALLGQDLPASAREDDALQAVETPVL